LPGRCTLSNHATGTTRSISQPTPHLVCYTTANNIKIAILSNSPDQQQYKDPKVAWSRIFRHTESDKDGCAAGRTSVQAAELESNTLSRKRGRPPGTKTNVANPKQLGASRHGEWNRAQ